MGKVKLNLAVSLDGFISRTNGDVDFLGEMNPDSEVSQEFNKFLTSIKSIIMGRKSFEKTLSFGPYPFTNQDTYVLTSNPKEDDQVNYTNQDINDLVNNIKDKGDIWLFGGGNVITQFINNDLIDEYIITIVPIIIGEGIPLFRGVLKDVELSLQKTVTDHVSMTLIYQKK